MKEEKMMENEIVLFETEDKSITLPVQVNADTVWLNRNQLAELFGRDIKTIGNPTGWPFSLTLMNIRFSLAHWRN
jgi:hypothetical protein